MENQEIVNQIQRFRELDSEVLIVEEVDSLQESSDETDDHINNRGYEGTSGSAEFTFDPCFAFLQSYLGEVEDTPNRLAFLDGGAVLDLSLFYVEGTVLFPGVTLPLRVKQPNFIAAVERALNRADGPYTLGVVLVYVDCGNGSIRFATTGTTAEIRHFRRLDDGTLNLVARGQQRFRLRRQWIDVEGAPCGEIQIIEEDSSIRTPRDAVGRLVPPRKLRSSSTFQTNEHGPQNGGDESEDSFMSELSSEERRLHESALGSSCGSDLNDTSTSGEDENFGSKSELQLGCSHLTKSLGSLHSPNTKNIENANRENGSKAILDIHAKRGEGRRKSLLSKLREVPRAFWPTWVYNMYDSYCLAQQVADMWKEIVKTPSMDGLVNNPDLMSFHIASKISVSESTRQELLEIDGVSYRLRREIKLLESFDRVRCKTCQRVIARRSDILVMSSDSSLGAYVNSRGFVHEIITLLAVNGLALVGQPIKEYSWFPGYAWTTTYCATCERQMGWRFTATNRNLKPQSFWGIRTCQIADDTS